MLASPSASTPSRSETLLGLANALTALAARMRTRDSVAGDFGRLVVRADRIASQAHLLNTSKWQFEENARLLAVELAGLSASVQEAAARVKAEASGNAVIADTLSLQAQRITKVATVAGPGEPGALRAELQPLEATLVSLQSRMRAESAVIQDSDSLAARAAELSVAALRLMDGGRAAGAAAMSIHHALRDFVGEAGSISKRMSGASAGLGEVADQMALRTREISVGRPIAGAPVEAVVWSGVQARR